MKTLLCSLLTVLSVLTALPGFADASEFILQNHSGQGIHVEYKTALLMSLSGHLAISSDARCFDPPRYGPIKVENRWQTGGTPVKVRVYKMVTKGTHMPYFCISKDSHLDTEKMFATEANFPRPNSFSSRSKTIWIKVDETGKITIHQ